MLHVFKNSYSLALVFLAGALMVKGASPTQAQALGASEPERPLQATLPTTQINHCVDLLLADRNDDGSMVLNSYPTLTTFNVDPYFGGYGILGLIENYRATKKSEVLAAIDAWLTWCAGSTRGDGAYYAYGSNSETEDPTGSKAAAYAKALPIYLRRCNFMWRFAGPERNTQSMKLQFPDSTDAYGGMVLLALGRLTRIEKTNLGRFEALADNAVKAVKFSQERQAKELKGKLTFATPTFRAKLLLDNVEVVQGLLSAKVYYTAIGKSAKADQAGTLADGITAELTKFYSASMKRFVDEVDVKDAQVSDANTNRLEVDGLANLWALAHFSGTPSPKNFWTYVNKFQRDAPNQVKTVPTGRWLMAAYGVDGATERSELQPLLSEIDQLDQLHNLSHYTGTGLLAIYGFYDRSARLPSIAFPKLPKATGATTAAVAPAPLSSAKSG